MELFIFRHDEYLRMYSCANISVERVPFAERQQLVNGWLTLAMYVVFTVLAVPCCVALVRRAPENSCYKLMMLIGLTDLVALQLIGGLTGWLAITGTVFCQHPTLIYVGGCFLEALWALETTANVVLAVNRCIEFAAPNVAAFLFQGTRTWAWVAAMLVYFVVYVLDVSIIFVPMQFAWFYNPYVGYHDELENFWLCNDS